jgi:hypothetical protein
MTFGCVDVISASPVSSPPLFTYCTFWDPFVVEAVLGGI